MFPEELQLRPPLPFREFSTHLRKPCSVLYRQNVVPDRPQQSFEPWCLNILEQSRFRAYVHIDLVLASIGDHEEVILMMGQCNVGDGGMGWGGGGNATAPGV